MKALTKYDWSLVQEFVDKAFKLGVEKFAYIDKEFSKELFMKRLFENGSENFSTFQHDKFERITYKSYYQRKSSSGKYAKTSMVHYKFDFLEGVTDTTENFIVSWPIHLMNRKEIHFNLSNNTVSYMNGTQVITSIDEMMEIFEAEYYQAVHHSFKKNIPDVFKGIKRSDMFSMPKSLMNQYALLCEMVLV